ncbi:MAG: tRNA (adenosine(37)-N6)-dimethylallyltransferase MiaA [Lentisphaeraceae bacterium]|nr:tRNA (adenosine(37)-N6)-dimethylallyltransferase MiaA [Lentisphaeraceae bacterium]
MKSIIVTAPTATGKTQLAVQLARAFNGEIISADSRQVYRGLDYGTGKDLEEYVEGGETIQHHIIDVVDPADDYSLYNWRSDYISAIKNIHSRNKLPIICGGTALYLDMILKDYELDGDKRDKDQERELLLKDLESLKTMLKKASLEVYEKTDLTQKERVIRGIQIATASSKEIEALPTADHLIIGPYWHRKVVHARIEARLEKRWEPMIDECEKLLSQGVSHERLQWFGLEYRAVSRFLLGEISKEEAFDELLIRIRQFAKRQDVWFRKIEKSGFPIYWLDEEDKFAEASQLVSQFLDNQNLPEPSIKISEITYGPRTQ